jgi:GNAT superfamily N-acetyltransferase
VAIKYLSEKYSRFFVALENGAEMGYIRINEKSEGRGPEYAGVWSISDGLVKKPYRSKGVFRALIQHVVDNFNVHMINIELDRALDCYDYYTSLGFRHFREVGDDGVLINLYKSDFVNIASSIEFYELSEYKEANEDMAYPMTMMNVMGHSDFGLISSLLAKAV